MISVIIPVHNAEKTILKSLESIALQYVKKELIIINDYSTDNSMAIVEEFQRHANFPIRIYFTDDLKNDRRGPTGAPNIPRNLGVDLAKGEYIALLDDDDWWEPGKLRTQLDALNGWDADICTTAFIAHNIATGTKRLHGLNTGKTVVVPDMLERFLRRDKSKQTLMSSMLFKKSIYPQMDEYFGLTDYLWTAKLLRGNALVSIEIPLTYSYVTGLNTSYKPYIREITMYEQLMTIAYFEHIYGYDLSEAKMGAYGSYARACYLAGEYKDARVNFLKSPKALKEWAYYFTSFVPPIAKYVCKKYNVWGDN